MSESSRSKLQSKYLADAIEGEDSNLRNIAALLDGIPNAYEQAQLGLRQAEEGDTISLNEL